MSAIDGLADHHQPGVLKRHPDVIPQHGRGVDAACCIAIPGWVCVLLLQSLVE
jgi:hypothetical protein